MRTAAAALLLVVASCAGTRWMTTWTGPQAAGAAPRKKILVIGMSSEATSRRMLEEALAAGLRKSKVEAAASYGILPRLTLDAEPLKARVREGGFDAVLVIRLVGRGSKSHPHPKDAPAYDPYWVGYSGWQGEVYTPGYLSSESIVRLETRLWSTEEGGNALWTGVSETVGIDDLAQACRELSSLVVDELKKCALI